VAAACSPVPEEQVTVSAVRPITNNTIGSSSERTTTSLVPSSIPSGSSSSTMMPLPPPAASVSTTTTVASPPEPSALASLRLALEPFADLPLLTAGVAHPSTGGMLLTSQSGEVWSVAPESAPELVLDLRGQVSPWVENSERGLLGIAFGPVDGRLYLSYTDADVDTHVDSYALDTTGRPDPSTRREVIVIDQPGLGHKGGGLAFEPTGAMLLAVGDGGASSGRDAQDLSLLLGAIVRITPAVDADGYQVPGDNPWIATAGARPELWAKGLRNPWGFCRDAATGDLWTADVGNKTMEEVNRVPPGSGGVNFGWPYIEGSYVRQRGAPDGVTPPVFAYRHDDIGPAAIGGCVYRGERIAALRGAYLFADITGIAFAIGAGDVAVRLPDRFTGPVTGFATMPDGELLLLTLYSGALRIVPG
jgi:glucose/arabinose dehydrogenase